MKRPSEMKLFCFLFSDKNANKVCKNLQSYASELEDENKSLREAIKWIVYGGIASGEVIMPNHLQDKLNQALKDGAS